MSKRPNRDGNIRQRTDGRWEARITTSDGKRRSYFGKTQAEVLAKLNAAKKQIAEGLPLSSERLLFGQYLTDWLETSVKPSVRPYTFQS